MKYLFVNLFSLVCMLLAGVGLTGCTDDKTEPDPGTLPSLEVKFLEAQYSTVKLEVTAANLTEIAYLATPRPMPRKHRRQRSSLRPASNLRLRTAFLR